MKRPFAPLFPSMMATSLGRRERSVAPRIDDQSMWPLDLGVVAMIASAWALALSRLSLWGNHWSRSAITYGMIAVVIGLAFAIISRLVVGRFWRRSMQFGLIVSVFVHLLLCVLATNYVVFDAYFMDPVKGDRPRRTPIRKTVPDYLFQTKTQSQNAVDWNRPEEVATASPVIPEESRRIPPLERSKPKMELPQPRVTRSSESLHLRRLETESPAMPQASDSPAKLARRRRAVDSTDRPIAASPTAPDTPRLTPLESEQSLPTPTARRSRRPGRDLDLLSPPVPANRADAAEPAAAATMARADAPDTPTIGASDSPRPRRRQTDRRIARAAAGAVPVPQTVAVARTDPAATQMLAPSPPSRRRRSDQSRQRSLSQIDSNVPAIGASPRADAAVPLAAAASDFPGLPEVELGDGGRSGGARTRRSTMDLGQIAGLDSPIDAPDVAMAAPDISPSDDFALAAPSIANASPGRRRRSGDSAADDAFAQLDFTAPEGPPGLSDAIAMMSGVLPSEDQPDQLAGLDLTPRRRVKRKIGGPVLPAGAEVASVESFARRVARTRGGASPAPEGQLGRETEQAIERGLEYLVSTQNSDGSWSLGGHGGDVVLASDTAATGLALLAFQGAGYTHRQHQYADTVGRGIQWLVDNQLADGNLYRPENALSDRNVMLYSHGIAALAMSEAYGMTQDAEIRDTAQGALDYITATQHRDFGGWRYSPQVSADTSVTGWMMMALKSGELSGLTVDTQTYRGIEQWLDDAQIASDRADRYRYNPFAPDTPAQRHGRLPTPTMTAVGMLMRMYGGWRRDHPAMQSAAEYLLQYKPTMGTKKSPRRDAYYWYYATQVMFHMGGDTWDAWNRSLNPLLLQSQIREGPRSGSWDPAYPVADRWAIHGGRLYVTTMNLLNLEVYYRHLPIYEDTAR